MKRAVVLMSGGLDSTTLMAYALRAGYSVYAISFDYEQRHRVELEAVRRLVRAWPVAHHLELKINLRSIGGSALTSDQPVPQTSVADYRPSTEIPVTYVPGRNLIFLSLAASYAESMGCQDIFIGVNALDYSGYPDCRGEFIRALETTLNCGTKQAVEGKPFRLQTPLLELKKSEIIRLGLDLGVDYSQTLSCYAPNPQGEACRHCEACHIRRMGFESLGIPDPTRYAAGSG